MTHFHYNLSTKSQPGGRYPLPQKFLVIFAGFSHLLENPAKSWIFLLKISRPWKVLENEFGSGMSWKLKFKVLESPGIHL